VEASGQLDASGVPSVPLSDRRLDGPLNLCGLYREEKNPALPGMEPGQPGAKHCCENHMSYTGVCSFHDVV
jgi:hypothetical protein